MSLFSKFFNSKKSENTVDEVGEIFFDAAYGLAKEMISKERDELKNLGFNKFNNHTLIELTIFFIFMRIKGLEIVKLPEHHIKQLILAIINSYFKFANNWANDDKEFNKFLRDLINHRLKEYQEVYKILHKTMMENKGPAATFEGPAAMFEAGDILIKIWKNLLRDDLQREGSFEAMGLSLFFLKRLEISRIKTSEFLKDWDIKFSAA